MTARQNAVVIDQVYLETAQLLQHPDQDQAGELRALTEEIDAVSPEAMTRDPCLTQKRRQLMPILISLGVINGLRDPVEQRALRMQALQHLASLGNPEAVVATGDICFGRGFPPILVGDHAGEP